MTSPLTTSPLLPSIVRERRKLAVSSSLDTTPSAGLLAETLSAELRDAGLYVRVGVSPPPPSRGAYDPLPPAYGSVNVFTDDSKDGPAAVTIHLHTALVNVLTYDGVAYHIPYAGRGWLAAVRAALASEYVAQVLATIKPAGV